MTQSQKISDQIQQLPQNLQQEVFDFIEFLKIKSKTTQDNEWWAGFSLSSAMSGLEDETEYQITNLKEKWR